MKTTRLALPLSLLAASALASALTTTYHVTQSVGSLSLGQPGISDPYLFLDFQLTDGSQLANGDSNVAISNLSLSGGSFDFSNATLANIGNVSGNGSAFTLRDGPASFGSLADHAVLFRVASASAVLTYDFTLTSPTAADAPSPDGFNVALLYRTGAGAYDLNVVQTLGPTGNEMVNYVFDAGPATRPMGFAVDPTFSAGRAAVGDNRFATLGVPVIAISPVPEPSAFAALGLGVATLMRRRRKA